MKNNAAEITELFSKFSSPDSAFAERNAFTSLFISIHFWGNPLFAMTEHHIWLIHFQPLEKLS